MGDGEPAEPGLGRRDLPGDPREPFRLHRIAEPESIGLDQLVRRVALDDLTVDRHLGYSLATIGAVANTRNEPPGRKSYSKRPW